MSESYNRRCKYCGQWIQMRNMPQGQWVAFDGYDTVHKCSKQYEQLFGQYHGNNPSNKNQPTYQIPTYHRPAESSGCFTIMLFFLVLFIGLNSSHKSR